MNPTTRNPKAVIIFRHGLLGTSVDSSRTTEGRPRNYRPEWYYNTVRDNPVTTHPYHASVGSIVDYLSAHNYTPQQLSYIETQYARTHN